MPASIMLLKISKNFFCVCHPYPPSFKKMFVVDHCGGLSNGPSKNVQLLTSNTCEVTLYCKGIAYGIKGLKMGRLLDYLGGP